MKITSKLVALAVSCVGIPATVLAHDADIIGPWELTIKVQNKTFSAISTCDKAHRVLEMDYAPPSIFGPSRAVEVGYGSWREENGHILLSYETALPHHMTRVVRGTATLTEPNVITGNVE
ncbi:MAG: hypothetical protein JO170_34350, partial [Verrucomicrobia bacterium]|nr:hypothetical protein [Verrucomicrobiota bacterium]